MVLTRFLLSEVFLLAWLRPRPGGQESHVSHYFLLNFYRMAFMWTRASLRRRPGHRTLWRICFWLGDIFLSPSVLPPRPTALWQAMKQLCTRLPEPVTSHRKHASFSGPTHIPCHHTVSLPDVLMGLVGPWTFSQVDLSQADRKPPHSHHMYTRRIMFTTRFTATTETVCFHGKRKRKEGIIRNTFVFYFLFKVWISGAACRPDSCFKTSLSKFRTTADFWFLRPKLGQLSHRTAKSTAHAFLILLMT